MKRFWALVSSILFVLASGISSATAAELFSFENTPIAEDEAHMVINEAGYESAMNSKMSVQPPTAASTDLRGKWLQCIELGPVCDPSDPNKDLLAWVLLPYCAETSTEICIEKLELAPKNSEFSEGKFMRTAQGGVRIARNEKHDLHEGSTPSLFELETSEAGIPKNYAAVVRLTQHFNHRLGRFETGEIIASVTPYAEITGDYSPAVFDPNVDPEFAYQNERASNKCAFVESGICGVKLSFPEDIQVRLTFRMPKTIGGWFSGRMKEPNISITEFSKSSWRAVFEAKPVEVAKLVHVKKKTDITVEKTFNIGSGGSAAGTYWAVSAGGPGGEDVFKFIELFREPTKDKSAGTVTLWNMMTISGSENNKCLADKSKVLGIVTTNAMGYDTGSPKFENGFLNYKVGGLHFMPDGKTEVQGTYDLVMRSETARCLYGFSKAPVSATVSVVGGESNSVATTTVSERNGWLKMAAYGFTFSQKTIKVKMTQKGATKATTINCVKGKLTKKVTAVAPKCPTGYKKR
jgi:hypothetical protein